MSAKRGPTRQSEKDRKSEKDLTRDLIKRMDDCPNAEALNARVLMPFMAALEDVCAARGYVLNVYGEAANLVFTGDADDAEQIYQLVEGYLDAKDG